MALLQPDRYFSRISAIDIRADILDENISAVLLDVDNTILSRADHMIPPDVLQWLAKLKHSGIPACMRSNNFHQHVFGLAEELELPIVAKALKPLPQGFIKACRILQVPCNNTVMIGDQLSTDILGAHVVGMKAYLVCPLVEQDLKHTVFVRNIERIFIADKEPEGAQACETLPSSHQQM